MLKSCSIWHRWGENALIHCVKKSKIKKYIIIRCFILLLTVNARVCGPELRGFFLQIFIVQFLRCRYWFGPSVTPTSEDWPFWKKQLVLQNNFVCNYWKLYHMQLHIAHSYITHSALWSSSVKSPENSWMHLQQVCYFYHYSFFWRLLGISILSHSGIHESVWPTS